MTPSITGPPATRRPPADTVPLTVREEEVLDLVVGGLTNGSVARRLGISERTVREHIGRIFLKLRVTSRVEAAVIATERRLAGGSGEPVRQQRIA